MYTFLHEKVSEIGRRFKVLDSHTLVNWMVSSSSASQDEASDAFRDWPVASSIFESILEETSCWRGRCEGIGKAIE